MGVLEVTRTSVPDLFSVYEIVTPRGAYLRLVSRWTRGNRSTIGFRFDAESSMQDCPCHVVLAIFSLV